MAETKIVFNTNVPVELALKDVTGKQVPSDYRDGMQQKFFTVDGKVFYVSDTVGNILNEKLAALGTQPGEFVVITKAEVIGERGRKSIRWTVNPAALSRKPQPARRGPVAAPLATTTPPAARATGTFGVALQAALTPASPAPARSWQDVLLSQTNALVDVYAAAVKHAAKHEGLVKPDMVQSAMITAFISLAKGSQVSR